MKYEITLTNEAVKFPLVAGTIKEDLCKVVLANLEQHNVVVKTDDKGNVIVTGYKNDIATQLKVAQAVHELLDQLDEEL